APISASTGTFSVADAPLTAGAITPPVAVEGQAFSNVAAFYFTDADPAGAASDYTATVTWGDGSSATLTSTPSADGQIVASAGGFDVQLSHTYAEELANQTFNIAVSDLGGAAAISASTSTFSVADAPLSAMATAITASEDLAFH